MITMSIAPSASSATDKRMERPLDNRKAVKSPMPKIAQDHVAPVKNLQHVPCKFFRHGTCTAGENCPFSHSLETERPVCKYHLKGNCKFGSKCALSHSLPVNDSAIPSGLSETNPPPNHLPFGNSMKHMPSSSISSSFPQKIQRTAFDQMDLKGSIGMKSNLLNPGFSASPPSLPPFSHSPGRSSTSSYLNNLTSTQPLLGTANHGKQLDDYSTDINSGLASSMNGVSIASSLATSPSSFSAASSASSNNLNGSKGLLHQQMNNENNRDYMIRHPSLLTTYANRPSSEKTTSLSKLPAELVKPNAPLQSPQLNGKVNSNLPKHRPSVNPSLTGIQLSSGATRRYAVRSNSYADAFPSVVSTSLPNRVDLNHQMDMSDDEQRYLNTPMGSFDEPFLGSSPVGKTSSSMKQLSAPLSMMSPTLPSRSTANTLQNSRFGAYFSKSKYVDTNAGSTKSTTPQQAGVAGAPMKMPSSFGVREESVFSSPINELTRPQQLARLKSEPIFRAGSVSPVTTGGINESKNDYTLSPGSNGLSRVSVANTSPAWNSTLEEETTFQMDD